MAILSAPISGFADEASLDTFVSANVGKWSGKGTVSMHELGSASKNYSITVEQNVVPEKPGNWSFTSMITGMPGSSNPSTTIYEVDAEGLEIATTQYETNAVISKSTNQELAYTLVHVDSVTNNTVTTTRDMTLNGEDSMKVLANIYQNGSLVEQFNYTLTKGQ